MNLTLCCIKCGSTENLNTAMNVICESINYNVKICDKCSDTITPKVVRECVEDRLKEFVELRDKMIKFGINIPENHRMDDIDDREVSKVGPTVVLKSEHAQLKPKEQKPQPSQSGPKKILRSFDSGKGVTRVNAAQIPQININSAIRNESANALSKGQIEQEMVVVQEDVELQSVDGLGKVPTVIQRKIKDSTGETDIIIAKVTNDDLIKRARGDQHFYADGYNLRACGLCKGKGATIGGVECPKCKGTGLI